jgi:hypothetical protein
LFYRFVRKNNISLSLFFSFSVVPVVKGSCYEDGAPDLRAGGGGGGERERERSAIAPCSSSSSSNQVDIGSTAQPMRWQKITPKRGQKSGQMIASTKKKVRSLLT